MPSPSIAVRHHLVTPRRPTPASRVEHLKNGGEPWGASAAARRSQPKNSGGTTATARLAGSERLWPVPHAPLSAAEAKPDGQGPGGGADGRGRQGRSRCTRARRRSARPRRRGQTAAYASACAGITSRCGIRTRWSGSGSGKVTLVGQPGA
jgi:hypothetical protein